MPLLSSRANLVPPSPIRKLAPLAEAAKRRGTKVYGLNIGQPDIKSPALFFEGVRHFSDEVIGYEGSNGRAALKTTWSRYMNSTLGLSTTPDQFLITTGGSESLLFSFIVTTSPGDQILTFDPTYANYLGFAAMAGITLSTVPSRIEDNFALPADRLIEEKLTPRTRAILLCTPNNPTGTLYSREEIQRLLNICNERNLFLILDETYRELVYDGRAPLSVLHIEPNNPRVIIVDSLSKRFSLTGTRIGCLYTTNEEVMAAVQRMAQARLSVATIEQAAAAYMLERIPADFVTNMVREYQTRRDTLYNAIRAIPGVTCHKPQGAFYTVVSLPIRDAEAFASYMLTDFQLDGKTTFVAPAGGFYLGGSGGENEIRAAYVLTSDAIRDSIAVLAAGLELYRRTER